ncbi:MAG: hypothetical protein HYU69_03275 [Bacteroidetes bacterium]|nr:hypothetical protein [Bacteroidota bacterium]
MSRSEKGYFKKYSTRHVIGGENDYIVLFNAIEKQNEYDETRLIKKLKKEKFIAHLAVLKKYLYKLILKSLRSYYEEGSIDFQIKSWLAEISILYERGLPDQAARVLQKTKRIATENEKLILLQEVNEWERKIIKNNLYKDQTPDRLSALEKEQDLLLRKSELLNKLLSHSERTFFADYHLGNEQKKVQMKKISSELDALYKGRNIAHTSFQSDFLYYRILNKHATILEPQSDPIDTKKKLLHLLESHPHAILNDPDSYIVTLFNILAGAEHLVDTKVQVDILNKISEFENANRRFLSFKNQIKIFSYLSIIRTHLFISTANFEEGQDYINNQLLKQMKRYGEKINSYDKIILNFNILYIYFGAQNYKMALRWSNKIINEYSENIADEVYETTKLINLIIHYELKNMLTISSVISSAERYFRSRPSSGTIPHFLQGIKNIFSAQGHQQATEETEEFKRLKDTIQESIRSDHDDRFLKNFDFISWIESKIQGRPFSDVLMEKTNLLPSGGRKISD